MDRVVETEGVSVEQAVEAALAELGVTRDQATIEVLDEGEAKGFLGMRRSAKARVRVSAMPDAAGLLKEAAETVLSAMGLHGTVTVGPSEDTGGLHVELAGKGDDLGILIGRHGQTLEALQTVLGAMANRATRERVRVTLDVEQYRERRRQELMELAARMADRVLDTGEPVVLRPMTPFERKVVHTALAENPEVQTHSEGEEPHRRITVEPAEL